MNKAYLTWPLMALGLAACVSMSDGGTAAGPQGLSPAEIVAARQSAFHLSAATFGSMKGVIASQGDVKTQAFAARGLARWARILPAMFPDMTKGVAPRAKPEIWSNEADFEAKAADYATAATKLADLAQAGDKEGFAAQYAVVGATCSSCHDQYRAEAKPAS